MSENGMLRGNFTPKETVMPEQAPDDPKAEFRKKAIESIGGSMVFVERQRLYYDPQAK